VARLISRGVTAALFAGVTLAAQAVPVAPAMTGSVWTHTVGRGDTLTSIGARFGIEPRTLAAANALDANARLLVGQTIAIDNRHLVPPASTGAAVVVNIPQRLLFHRGETVTAVPVAVGKPDWPTPRGVSTVVSREENPTWDVPASIAEEARRAGKTLPKSIPPGPQNPLGAYWLGLSRGGIGLHGTNAPASIYRAATHGCIRLHPDDIAWLFPRVSLGAEVEIVYEPVLLAQIDGRIWLEAHGDVYRRAPAPAAAVRARAEAQGLSGRIDWELVTTVLARRHGIARDVTAR
jgi:L,D-transpeptidase ErfK/SrfK